MRTVQLNHDRSIDRNSGFTYLELIIVLVILALGATIAVPAIQSSSKRTAVRLLAADIESTMRQARAQAISSNASKTVTFDLKARRYWSTQPTYAKSIDRRVDVEIASLSRETRDHDKANIRFMPDGSSSGGTIWLTSGTTKLRLDVDWLTGHARTKTNG